MDNLAAAVGFAEAGVRAQVAVLAPLAVAEAAIQAAGIATLAAAAGAKSETVAFVALAAAGAAAARVVARAAAAGIEVREALIVIAGLGAISLSIAVGVKGLTDHAVLIAAIGTALGALDILKGVNAKAEHNLRVLAEYNLRVLEDAPAELQPNRMSVEETLAPLRGRATEANIANEETCTICMNALKINDEIITHKEKHFYHFNCMKDWGEACFNGHREITCPVCRLSLAS